MTKQFGVTRGVGVVVAFLMMGCSDEVETTRRYGKAVAEQEVKNELAARMKDPGTVEWRNVASAEVDAVVYVCGEFNATNSFGARPGFEWFAGRKGDVITAREAEKEPAQSRYDDYRGKCFR